MHSGDFNECPNGEEIDHSTSICSPFCRTWDTESLVDNLGSDSEEKDSYEKFERDRKFMGSKKINMTAIKYFKLRRCKLKLFPVSLCNH